MFLSLFNFVSHRMSPLTLTLTLTLTLALHYKGNKMEYYSSLKEKQ
jgi:hypothetical protein